jgi:16S rRNA (uracil1498-N3)-methyltransferase
MRIYLPPELISLGAGIALPPDKCRHIAAVMRLEKGDEFIAIDGMGRSYRAVISSVQKKNVHIDILQELPVDTGFPVELVLCQSVLKGEKMDFVMQKATEVGAGEIIPLIAERCQVRRTGKTERWRKIAEESVEQCGGALIPVVHEPVAFNDFIKAAVLAGDSGKLIFMEDWGRPVDEALDLMGGPARRIYILIGPEGGFSPAEFGAAEQAGFIRATLGRRILRAETAAVASLVITRFVLERRIGSG